MNSERVQYLTRQELYELVWDMPMTKAAKKFGISDVALRKICVKHRVPRPPVGYWASKRLQKLKQPSLPKVKDEVPIRIRRTPAEEKGVDITEVQIPAQVLTALKADPPKKLSSLVVETRVLLEKGHVDRYGFLRPYRRKASLDIIVTKSSLHRALYLLERLARVCKADGIIIEEPCGREYEQVMSTVLKKGENEVSVRIKERVKQIDLNPDPKAWGADKFGYIATGVLELNVSAVGGFSKRWSDRSGRLVESRVEDAVRAIYCGMERHGEWLREREKSARNYEIGERRRHLKSLKSSAMQSRRDNFDNYKEEIARVIDYEKFIDAVAKLTVRHDKEELAGIDQWLDWAKSEFTRPVESTTKIHLDKDRELQERVAYLQSVDVEDDSVDWSGRTQTLRF